MKTVRWSTADGCQVATHSFRNRTDLAVANELLLFNVVSLDKINRWSSTDL